MTVINILAPHVADMIAAGEVVERPASVIKELVENSIDADAKSITIEIKNGGATYIRVTDDGKGMSPEDAGIAFLRHATSKLKDERGLEAIGTMGFRGEALAAISAVSRIELQTREADASLGTRMILEGGDIQEMEEAGCPKGTMLVVRDLFYNTPARLKFLKSDRAEASACTQTAVRCALSRPDISYRYIRDGKEEFFTAGDGDVLSALYAVFGRDFAAKMLPCNGESNGITVKGYVSSPAACRGNRAYQYFFCNNRFIKSPLLQAAVEQAYENAMLVGHYPACAIYVDIGLGSVDVNVHPTKTEVKFMEEKKVFDAVYYAALSAVKSETILEDSFRKTTGVAPSEPAAQQKEPSKGSYEDRPHNAWSNAAAPTGPATYGSGRYSGSNASQGQRPASFSGVAASPRSSENEGQTGLKDYFSRGTSQSFAVNEKRTETSGELKTPSFRLIGEAMDTYILVQKEESLVVIDKHACHERIIFDKLIKQERNVMAQMLMVPVTVRVDEKYAGALEENRELLTGLGFDVEPYGESHYIIRAVPADMYESDVESVFDEICEQITSNREIDAETRKTEILKTVACKAAIKAGWKTDVKELFVLAEAVVSGKIKYCPHGRPVAVVYTREQLDKEFKRIV